MRQVYQAQQAQLAQLAQQHGQHGQHGQHRQFYNIQPHINYYNPRTQQQQYIPVGRPLN